MALAAGQARLLMLKYIFQGNFARFCHGERGEAIANGGTTRAT
jgi:hypothetical protein